jgi:hypothetical protein
MFSITIVVPRSPLFKLFERQMQEEIDGGFDLAE